MFRIIICYGHPADPAAFDEYYTKVHVPLARKISRVVGFTTGKCQSLTRTDPPYYMTASLSFATAAAMKTALRSPQMVTASADVANFATGGVTIFSQEDIDRMAD